MNSVTNVGPGARMINVKTGERKDKEGKSTPIIELVHIAPGETKDVEILDSEDRVFKGMVDAGDLVVGEPGTVPPTPAEKIERDAADLAARVEAARKIGFDEGYAKAQADAKDAKK